MSRLADAILNGAYNREPNKPVLDLQYGGQHGWTPNLTEWVSNAAYVSRPLTCILIEAPRMFTAMPNGQKWTAALKAMFELHARSIDGLNATLTVDTDQHPVGGAGEQQEEVVNVTRERSVPKFTFVEKYGRPIQNLLDFWIRYGFMDPDTKYALLGIMNRSDVKDLLPDWYSATCLFFVADPLFKTVDKAWLVTNMYPKGAGEITAKRDLTTSQEILTLDVEFAGIAQYGLGVNKFAQTILNNIRTTNADPFMKPAFAERIAPDVEAATGVGFRAWTEKVGSTAVSNMNT